MATGSAQNGLEELLMALIKEWTPKEIKKK